MFGTIAKVLGGALTTIGLSFGGMAAHDGAPHAFALQIAAIVCTGLGAGFLAVAPSVVQAVNVKAANK